MIMSFTIFSVAIILIFATAAIIEIYRGIERGFQRTLIELGVIAVGIILSALISPLLSKAIVKPILDLTLRKMGFYESFISEFRSLDLLIEALVCIIISALLFMILFFILRGILGKLVMLFVGKALKARKDDPGYSKENVSFFYKNNKVLGGILGAVCAILVTMVSTSPVLGLLDVSGTAVTAAEEINPNVWAQFRIDAKSMDMLQKYSNDVPGNIIYRCGGEYMFRATASTELYGKRVYLTDELDTVIDTLKDFSYVLTVVKTPEKSNPLYIERINSLCDNIQNLNIVHGVLAEFMAKEANAWLEGSGGQLTQSIPSNAVTKPIFDEITQVCAKSNESNIRENITTLLRVYAIFLDSGLHSIDIENPDDLIEVITKSDVIQRIQDELSANPSMKRIRVSALALNVLARQIIDKGRQTQDYLNLMDNIADAISTVQNKGYGTMDERVTVLTDRVKQYVTDYGVDISDKMAQYTSEELLAILEADGALIPADQIDEIFADYSN